MKNILYVLCFFLLVLSCHKQDKADPSTEIAVENVSVADQELDAEINSDNGFEDPSSNSVSSHYSEIDFSALPVTAHMLDSWNEVQRGSSYYQYRNSSFDIFGNKYNKIRISDAIGYNKKYGISEEEKKIVGYWFALDGADKNNENMSFMDALRRSRYPSLQIHPCYYFTCNWTANGTSLIYDRENKDPVDGLDAIFFRGKWEIREGKVILIYYQYLIGYENEEVFYYNLSTPYELELVSLDAISPDNISTEPFAAFTQPAEIMEQIPDTLIFINKPEYFIKAQYVWSEDPFDSGYYGDHMVVHNRVYYLAKYLREIEKNRGITLDDILTSTEGRLQEDYWH